MKNNNLFNCLGLKPAVVEKLVTGKDLEVHFGGADGQVIGYIQDWEKNVTVVATPPVFKSGDEAHSFLRGLLDFVRDSYQQPCPA
jgi:hypothetical protein